MKQKRTQTLHISSFHESKFLLIYVWFNVLKPMSDIGSYKSSHYETMNVETKEESGNIY